MTTILKQNLKRCTKQPQRDIKMTQKRNNNKIQQKDVKYCHRSS